MKKKILTAAKILVIVMTAIAVLTATTGCRLLNWLLNGFDPYQRSSVKFSEMEYTRPDAEKNLEKLHSVVSMIDGSDGKSHMFSDMKKGVYEAYDLIIEWQSMETLAYVHFSIDTTSTEWAEEMRYFNENSSKISQAYEEIYVACARSEFKAGFEKELFMEGFLDDYVDGGTLNDEIAALMQRESQLVTQFGAYDYMETEFEIDGVKGTIADHAKNIVTKDDHDKVYTEFYKRVNSDTGPILIELVKVRNEIAKAAGYGSYAEFAYEFILDRDYTPEQARNLVEQIKQKVTPLYKKAASEGLFDILYDVEAVPLSAGQVTDAVENALTGARREFKDSFSYMDKNELCYLGYDSRQLSASYTTYIPKYNAPITVILGSGNVSDVLTLAHEFGHFTEGFLNYGIINNIDMSEIPSTTLEYLFLSRIDDSGLGAREIETLKKYKKASSLDLYISQCLYYTFEDRLYSMAEKDLTLDNVNALARDVINEFGLEDNFEYFDYSWSMIEHFYQQAFYVISYVTADFVSLQIASLEAGKKGDGFKMYLTLINWHDSKTFTEQLEFRSLESPFSDGAAGLLVTNLQKVLGI